MAVKKKEKNIQRGSLRKTPHMILMLDKIKQDMGFSTDSKAISYALSEAITLKKKVLNQNDEINKLKQELYCRNSAIEKFQESFRVLASFDASN